MSGQSYEVRGQSVPVAILCLLLVTIASIIFAVTFVATYVTLSEYHQVAQEIYFPLLGVSDKAMKRHMEVDIIWVLDATVAFICLFLIVEDAFLLYELNCELRALNSTAHLSLREALEIDNRYLKDAIILEAKEAQEESAGATAKTHKSPDDVNGDVDADDTVKISKMISRPRSTTARSKKPGNW
ncbi:hypothetical protein GCK32_004418 [Trichostrongylus colubriformis]|uniref:Uncharacterized protein n=1 Tax=Trichostrongylus colubriformis TaxID=6319 RepID=A0AAN8FNL6_TRICO